MGNLLPEKAENPFFSVTSSIAIRWQFLERKAKFCIVGAEALKCKSVVCWSLLWPGKDQILLYSTPAGKTRLSSLCFVGKES